VIRTLLNKQIHFSQLLFFALTSSLGLGILLVAFQLFIDTQSLFSTSNDLLGNQHLIINKDLGRENAFTPEEIATIKEQKFVKKIGGFTHGTYRVVASVSVANYTSISTEMFLEAVPDEFLDIQSTEWNWKPGNREVPIIIPKNYVNLYNFGYAASTGMPQINENIIREIPIELNLYGSSKREKYNAYILDASEKINSILVPESFLKYTNKTLSPEKTNKVSRIILEVNNPSDPTVLDFLNSNNYKYLQNDLQTSKTSYFLQLILIIVLGIGILITILSITLVVTNINLLILKNKQTICQLHFLGFSSTQIAKVYHQISYKILGVSILIAFLFTLLCKFLFAPYLVKLRIDTNLFSLVYVFVAAIILFIVLVIYYTKHTNKKIQQMTAMNTSLLTSEI